eukprot:6173745-Pleurochrysis_carterae.AAC.2
MPKGRPCTKMLWIIACQVREMTRRGPFFLHHSLRLSLNAHARALQTLSPLEQFLDDDAPPQPPRPDESREGPGGGLQGGASPPQGAQGAQGAQQERAQDAGGADKSADGVPGGGGGKKSDAARGFWLLLSDGQHSLGVHVDADVGRRLKQSSRQARRRPAARSGSDARGSEHAFLLLLVCVCAGVVFYVYARVSVSVAASTFVSVP